MLDFEPITTLRQHASRPFSTEYKHAFETSVSKEAMRTFQIDSSKVKHTSKASVFLQLSGLLYCSLMILLVSIVSMDSTEVIDIKILVYTFMGFTIIFLLLAFLVKRRNQFMDFVLKIDIKNELITREAAYARKVEMKFDEVGRVKFTNDGILVFKKGYQTLASYLDSKANLYDRKTRFIIPFEMQNYEEIKKIIEETITPHSLKASSREL